MKIKIYIFFWFLFTVPLCFSQNLKHSARFDWNILEKDKNYLGSSIIVKLKPEYREILFQNKTAVFSSLSNDIVNIERMFPEKEALRDIYNRYGQPLVDLSLIHILQIDTTKNITSLIDEIFALGYFEYVEPYLIPELFYTPNDPFLGQMYHLSKIKAYEAWDITQGDTNIVIGIVDTGTDLYHPDLQGNIKYNYEDPLNGFDTDNDGFVDNYYGWNLGENNNMPQFNAIVHGVHISGISSSVTNNGGGIAGVAYKCKYIPVKIDNAGGQLTMGYQGIVYAADKGSRIINCSWGSTGGAGQFGQDIVNYANYNKNALVVAAAGNSSGQHLYYPASYNNVLSVTATDADDLKWPQSTYHFRVDICAPGHNIYSTMPNGAYQTSSGSSMAAAVVSGAAALLATYYPNFIPLQLIAQLKSTADNIDTIAGNLPYAGKLGKGRLNIFRALTENNIPYVRMISHNLTAEEYGSFSENDTFLISGNFVNYLGPTNNLTCTLRALSPYVSVIDSIINFPNAIGTLDTVNNNNFPFKVKINQNIPFSTPITFELIYQDINYNDKEHFTLTFNVDYLTLDTNKITVTLTSKSRIGYNNETYSQGKGLLYQNLGQSLLTMGGLIVGISPSQVVDNIYGSVEGSYNNDFFALTPINKTVPGLISDFDATSMYSDSMAGIERINIKVINNYYAWNNPLDEKYFISEYLIINNGADNLQNLYAGLFMDWKIPENNKHRIDFDVNTLTGYAFSTDGDKYTGTKLLSGGNYRFYAFDNINGLNFVDGFTNYEKYTALRTNKLQAGILDDDNNTASLFSSGPHTINPNDTIKVAFAILVGDFLGDIISSANAAQIRYNNDDISIYENLAVSQFILEPFPNPAKNQFFFSFTSNICQNLEFELYNAYGQVISTKEITSEIGHQTIEVNTGDLSKGLYFIKLKGLESTATGKIVIQ
ncbi:MAG: S8 family peptidase [Bacteroidales bacterium]|nr:S8 family peptidase [Bacteroidales bacterium]